MLLNIKNNKFYFLLKFRLIFLNFKYLTFINLNLQEYKDTIKYFQNSNIRYLKLRYNHINILFLNKYINSLFKNNYYILYNNYFDENFLKLNYKNYYINAFSFSGFFINSNYISKLNIIYNYYVNNYNIFLLLINKYINIYLLIIYLYISKLLTLFLKLGLKKLLN